MSNEVASTSESPIIAQARNLLIEGYSYLQILDYLQSDPQPLTCSASQEAIMQAMQTLIDSTPPSHVQTGIHYQQLQELYQRAKEAADYSTCVRIIKLQREINA